MQNDSFWISDDGAITTAKPRQDSPIVDLTITFKLRNPAEIARARKNLKSIQFSERSTLARLGIEIDAPRPPRLNKDRLILSAEAFLYDESFPCAPFFIKLVSPGTRAGRLFFAPESQKLTSEEIWKAIDENRIKLPNTTSIDRYGRVYLTPHKVRYTMPGTLSEDDHLRIIKGYHPRSYLDKVQLRQELEMVAIPPHSGLLSSCSMYLKEHYVVLNRGEGNFGLHSGAVLLDPVKTFGTNVVLEIYNRSDQPVINPVVSIEVYRAPGYDQNAMLELRDKRQAFFSSLGKLYRHLDENPKAHSERHRPTTDISLSGQSARTANQSVIIHREHSLPEEIKRLSHNGHFGHRTLSQALRKGDARSDTLIMDRFPSLTEHIEILARFRRLNLKRLVFRKATHLQDFFLPNDAHSMLETYAQIGLKVYWYSPYLNDVYVHVYKNGHGFFIREEDVKRFLSCTILAFYGSALEMSQDQIERITQLVVKMTDFFGTNVGILTGGGEGVMGLAVDVARSKQCLTGAAYLELEAQAPKVGVDFFNTFQEENRHNRQKWFQVADFCIFNMGGAGTMEEIGIELCNLKLGIRPRSPFVFFHTEYWNNLRQQFDLMVKERRMPSWMQDYLLFSDDPDEILDFYKKTLQIV